MNDPKRAPAWMTKHPCSACGMGYGMCAQFWTQNMMCCKGCEHPSRWQPNPWTAEDVAEMQARPT